jgi:hypothetical protein
VKNHVLNVKRDWELMKKTVLKLTFILMLLLSLLTEIQAVFLGSATTDTAENIADAPHAILIESPNNYTIYETSMHLNFTVTWLTSDDTQYVEWWYLTSLSYSIDDKPSVTLMNGTISDSPFKMNEALNISELRNGQHKIEVKASFLQNSANLILSTHNISSAPVYFAVEVPEPFPTTLVAASATSVAVIGLGLIVYFKKCKH